MRRDPPPSLLSFLLTGITALAALSAGSGTTGRLRATLAGLLCVPLLATASGCYYGHLAAGQTRVLLARRAVEDLLADSETASDLRERLLLVQQVREFATRLGLEVEGQYTSYVAWPGDRIVTSLIVTEPGRVEARPFRFPLIGSVPYKGFFDQARAEREAETLRSQGLDVCLVAVPAYSTLGFFDDPLTDPMLRATPGRLVDTVIHELVHATVFLRSQPEFNEGVASFVGQEASVRFYAELLQHEQAGERRREIGEQREIAGELLAFRERVRALYREESTAVPRAELRAALESDARASLARRVGGGDAEGFAERVRLNDACLALRSTYAGDMPQHAALLERLQGDLPRFIERLRSLRDSDDPRAAFFAAE